MRPATSSSSIRYSSRQRCYVRLYQLGEYSTGSSQRLTPGPFHHLERGPGQCGLAAEYEADYGADGDQPERIYLEAR